METGHEVWERETWHIGFDGVAHSKRRSEGEDNRRPDKRQFPPEDGIGAMVDITVKFQHLTQKRWMQCARNLLEFDGPEVNQWSIGFSVSHG